MVCELRLNHFFKKTPSKEQKNLLGVLSTRAESKKLYFLSNTETQVFEIAFKGTLKS